MTRSRSELKRQLRVCKQGIQDGNYLVSDLEDLISEQGYQINYWRNIAQRVTERYEECMGLNNDSISEPEDRRPQAGGRNIRKTKRKTKRKIKKLKKKTTKTKKRKTKRKIKKTTAKSRKTRKTKKVTKKVRRKTKRKKISAKDCVAKFRKTKKYERCVLKVKAQNKKNKSNYNPWAICTSSLKKTHC